MNRRQWALDVVIYFLPIGLVMILIGMGVSNTAQNILFFAIGRTISLVGIGLASVFAVFCWIPTEESEPTKQVNA